MTTGTVEAIYIATHQGEPTFPVEQIRAVPGMGLEDDRYYGRKDIPSSYPNPAREVTLIEMEAIEAMQRVDGINISPMQTRRNITTRGISLNDLVNSLFFIGDVQLKGVRLCEPCQYLADRTDPRLLNSMSHRGGLRAEIITEGIIRIHDIITTTQESI